MRYDAVSCGEDMGLWGTWCPSITHVQWPSENMSVVAHQLLLNQVDFAIFLFTSSWQRFFLRFVNQLVMANLIVPVNLRFLTLFGVQFLSNISIHLCSWAEVGEFQQQLP